MKYDKSAIMRDAWRIYRICLRTPFVDRTFASCLGQAWAIAKDEAEIEDNLKRGLSNRIKGNICHIRPECNVGDTGRNGWVVTGQTYYARNALKKMGFCWDPEFRCWYTEELEVAKQFARA